MPIVRIIKLKPIIEGLMTFVPGIRSLFVNGTTGSDEAKYCYSVWLRHLVMAQKTGFNPWPHSVAELGPGDSLGVGLAALLSGSSRYLAFDVVQHANRERNHTVLNELVDLFKARIDIPGEDDYPRIKPYLDDYRFPADILTSERLKWALSPKRIEMIRSALETGHTDTIGYRAPWFDINVIEPGSVDMIFSQAALEHIDDLANAYRACRHWIKPNGLMSHQIDFKCHGISKEWNGHWAYPNFLWKVVRGRLPYLLNREPYSTHVKLLRQEQFNIVKEIRYHLTSNIQISDLPSRFRHFSDMDLTTSGLFFQAVCDETCVG